ncbi:hypothetical protein JWG44_05650 [Leptospira sp. 201903071]|uniref:hypothetical protein n=1 Tax=Leptospira ainazelensis TaxID=2810034 RepID=UPI0019652DCC|nr:hypothetical protein [Leptospira ainazelensis]MBM9499734.1 hypothetical protein [Leptospira ainazelensis]
MTPAIALKGVEQNNKIAPVYSVGYGSMCGYIAACVIGSAVIPKMASVEYIRWFVDYMEPRFGAVGIGEKILQNLKLRSIVDTWRRYKEIRLGRFMECYAEALKEILKDNSIEVVLKINGNWSEIDEALEKGSAVMLGTSLTKSGHFIVLRRIVYINGIKYYEVIDSYGDWTTGYKKKEINNRYLAEDLVSHCGIDSNKGIHANFIYLIQLGI